jgi:glycerate kinase
MRYLVAPDKFKGTLTADEVAQIIGSAVRSVDQDADIELLPIADGGEGTACLLARYSNARRETFGSIDPIGRPIEAEYFVHGSEAIIEMSAASGLWRIEPADRAPLISNTYGTGIVLWHLIENGIQRIMIGLGGSATVDAGFGMAAALGYLFEDRKQKPVDPIPTRFSEIENVIPPIIQRFPEVIGLADVENRLTGLDGGICVYGPQKGLSPVEAKQLDLDLQELVKRLENTLGNFADFISAGAAGGFGFGILAFLKGKLVSGFQVFAERVNLANRVAQADVVITGEGKIDSQSLQGKGPIGVARIARTLNKTVWAIAGLIDDHELVSPHFHKMTALVSGETSISEALDQSAKLLYQRTRELTLASR